MLLKVDFTRHMTVDSLHQQLPFNWLMLKYWLKWTRIIRRKTRIICQRN